MIFIPAKCSASSQGKYFVIALMSTQDLRAALNSGAPGEQGVIGFRRVQGMDRMIVSAALIFLLRALSGVGTMIMLLMVAHFYSGVEIAQLAIFMFFFNLLTVIATWGGNTAIIDNFNDENAESKKIPLLFKLLDAALVVILAFVILSPLGYWNYGFLGVVPLSFVGVLAALLVVKQRPLIAMLFNEFSRALLPLLCVLTLLLVVEGVAFEQLMAVSYLALFVLLPVALVHAGKHDLISLDVSLPLARWWQEKKHNFYIMLPQLMIVIVAQGDRFVVEWLGTSQDLAAYFSAQTLYMVIVFAGHALFSVLTPNVSKVAGTVTGELKREGRLMLGMSAVLSIVLLPFAYYYFDLIGVVVELSMSMLIIFMLGNLISLLFGVGLLSLQYVPEKTRFLNAVLAGMTLQYLFVLLLYKSLGVYAVALGFVVYSVTTAIASWCFWKSKGVGVAPFSWALGSQKCRHL
jgi:hypothetical protein